MYKTKAVRINVDVIGEDGDYLRSFMGPKEDDVYVCHHTRAGVLWASVKARCTKGNTAQTNRLSYEETVNNFSDFQSFASWCNEQQGYMSKDARGGFWHLDKDIIIPFSKEYSPETCCFVPTEVNNLFTYSSKSRGEYPLGVHLDKRCGQFVSQINKQGKRKFLGYFVTAIDAHRAYQVAKIESIEEAIKNNLGVVDSKVIEGMALHKELLMLDLTNNLETKR
jgi:hypothetical protein